MALQGAESIGDIKASRMETNVLAIVELIGVIKATRGKIPWTSNAKKTEGM